MKRNILFLSLVLIFSFICSCASSQSSTSSRGEIKRIRLAGNPTTGYSWELKSQNNDCVKVVNSDYEQDKTDTKVVGAGGNFYFDVQAVKSGETELVFNYVRPWDKDDVAKIKSVIVIVNEDLKISTIE